MQTNKQINKLWALTLHVFGIFRILNNSGSRCSDSRLSFLVAFRCPQETASLSTTPSESFRGSGFILPLLSNRLSLGKEQVPALASGHVSRRDLPQVHNQAQERNAFAQRKWQWELGGWVTIQPSLLWSLDFPMTPVYLCYDMASCLADCPLGGKSLDEKGSGNYRHSRLLCS